MAELLIQEFGSLPELLAAPSEQLRRAGGSEEAIAAIAAAGSVVRRSVTARLETRPVMTRSTDFKQYLRAHVGYERVETVRVLYLDAARRLIADEQAGRGRPDEAPLYVRTILGRALELSATGIVVAHNHPSGVLRPSSADRLVTSHLLRAAEVVGIVLLDHVIVTRGGCLSIVTEVGGTLADGEGSLSFGPVMASATVRSPWGGVHGGPMEIATAPPVEVVPPGDQRGGRRRPDAAASWDRAFRRTDGTVSQTSGHRYASVRLVPLTGLRRVRLRLRRLLFDPAVRNPSN